MRKRTACIGLLLGGLAVGSASPATALNELTHGIINEQAARQSQLDRVLKEHLGFRRGIEEAFNGQEALQWLRNGGIAEDSPLCRSARHFHDPLRPWANAGLSTVNPAIVLPCGSFSFPSSLVWTQSTPQDLTGTLNGIAAKIICR